MVNKFLLNLALEYGARVGKSVFNAYQRVVNSKSFVTWGIRPWIFRISHPYK